MKPLSLFAIALALAFTACRTDHQASTEQVNANRNREAVEPVAFQNSARVAHVLVALCDNVYQGIVPVPAKLGNGEDLQGNLYWGAGYGIRTFFSKSLDWKLVARLPD